jgi:hypothetical protein
MGYRELIEQYHALEKKAEIAAQKWCAKQKYEVGYLKVMGFGFTEYPDGSVTFERRYGRQSQIHAIPLSLIDDDSYYCILDNITGELLSLYDANDPNKWDWGGKLSLGPAPQPFATEEETSEVIDHLNKVFLASNEKIDFKVLLIKGQEIVNS